ncbi:MAG: MerR family transcriptional regulator [Clostridia bacterium]|nr:MerR family transcriptional regulator [Clostridia bacterium]
MYTIHEVCEKSGLTAHTLRYYEKEGLLSNVSRSQGGFRQYSDEDLEAVGLICCLKNTGMPLSDIARFMELTREGDQTLRERCEMLKRHKEVVLGRMSEMERHLEKVTHKLDRFSSKLSEYEKRTKPGNLNETDLFGV